MNICHTVFTFNGHYICSKQELLLCQKQRYRQLIPGGREGVQNLSTARKEQSMERCVMSITDKGKEINFFLMGEHLQEQHFLLGTCGQNLPFVLHYWRKVLLQTQYPYVSCLQVIDLFILQKRKGKATVSPSKRHKSAEAEHSDGYFEQQKVRKNSVFALSDYCLLNVCVESATCISCES